MQRHTHHSLAYYAFDSFRDSGSLVHAVSTRHGGVSPAPFNTLNLSRVVGDDNANVTANLAQLHHALALDETMTVDASQAQADQVALVDERHRGTRRANVDVLITNTPNLNLMLRFADCVPILMYDPTHRAIGIAHAGWRGTVLKIVTRTVQAMMNTFATRPQDLIAGIAPSIGPCCYQIGDDVIARVREAYTNADDLLVSHNGGVHLDLWQANATQLRALGVEQIEMSNVCTAHRTDDFYSWRAEQGKTGRFGVMIALRNV